MLSTRGLAGVPQSKSRLCAQKEDRKSSFERVWEKEAEFATVERRPAAWSAHGPSSDAWPGLGCSSIVAEDSGAKKRNGEGLCTVKRPAQLTRYCNLVWAAPVPVEAWLLGPAWRVSSVARVSFWRPPSQPKSFSAPDKPLRSGSLCLVDSSSSSLLRTYLDSSGLLVLKPPFASH